MTTTVIDTNVVSESMRLTPEPAVMAWFARRNAEELYLTACVPVNDPGAWRSNRR